MQEMNSQRIIHHFFHVIGNVQTSGYVLCRGSQRSEKTWESNKDCMNYGKN